MPLIQEMSPLFGSAGKVGDSRPKCFHIRTSEGCRKSSSVENLFTLSVYIQYIVFNYILTSVLFIFLLRAVTVIVNYYDSRLFILQNKTS